MSDDRLTLDSRKLREAFDRGFAVPSTRPPADLHAVLTVRVAGVGYAIRSAEIAGIVTDRKIVPLPSPQPALLGLAGLRASLVPVYSLAVLLGQAADQDPPRWLALGRPSGGQVGFAFEELEGHAHLTSSSFQAAGEGAGRHVRQVARFAGSARPVLSLDSMIEAIRGPAGRGGTEEG